MTHSISQRPSRPRRAGLGLAILAALYSGYGVPLAFADSGIGVDTWRGNSLDPTGGMQSENCDINGNSWLSPLRHSPTGNLYDCPRFDPLVNKVGGWLYYGVIQIGYIGTGEQNYASWNRYADWQNNMPILGLIDLEFIRPSDGTYAEVRGSYISDDDQYYQAVYGRAGSYKVQAFIRDMPNILSTDAKSMWSGVGTNMMPLLPGFMPGNTSSAQATSLVNGLPVTTIGVTRNKQGLGGSMYLNPEWTVYLNLSNEERNGERPFGGPFGSTPNTNSDMITTLMPVNDSTINITGGARYAGPTWRFDVSYTGSFYRDKYTGYYWQQPFLQTGGTGTTLNPANTNVLWGQMSTPPDNDYNNIQASLTRKLPWNGELSLSAAVGQMSQDDAILPNMSPLTCPTGSQFGPFTISGVANQYIVCSQWNSAASLARSTADMKIDTSMFDAHIVLNPTSSFTFRAGVNANNQDYRGNYTAYNPLNGMYGYIIESGAGFNLPSNATTGAPPGNTLALEFPVNGVFANSGTNRVSSIPLSMLTIDANVGADWKFSEKNTLGITLDNIHYEPDNREVDNLDTSSIKLTWVNRTFNWLTLRANYTYTQANGSAYAAMNIGLVQNLPNYTGAQVVPPNRDIVNGFVRYDMANYSENKIDLMATFIPRDDMTITASARDDLKSYSTNMFSPQYGRTGYDTSSANLQWEWQPTGFTGMSAYVAWDRSRLNLADVRTAGTPSTDWWMADKERDWYGGFTFRHDFDRVRFDLGWNYIYSRGVNGFDYLTPNILLPTPVDPSTGAAYAAGVYAPGSVAFPNMVYRINSITAGVTLPVNARISVRLFDYYEIGRISDWHYTGLNNNLVINQHMYTDAGPQSYKENLIGLLLNIKL